MATAPEGTCIKCGSIFFATASYMQRVGKICATCARLPEGEVISEEILENVDQSGN